MEINKKSEYHRRWRLERIAAGLCGQCGVNTASLGILHCHQCRLKHTSKILTKRNSDVESKFDHLLPILERDGFGYWLSGIIDGEGCFRIAVSRGGDQYRAEFGLKLRDDDECIIRLIQTELGIGNIHHDSKGRGASKPCIRWSVQSRKDCAVLSLILEKYSLRTRKRRDFIVWKDAVTKWMTLTRSYKGEQKDIHPLAPYKALVEEARAYVE